MKNLEDLFLHTLEDIYFAENAILKALPKMAEKADSSQLRQAFESHLKETEGQIERLDKVFNLFGKTASGTECPAIEGIVEEAEEVMSDADDPTVRDAGMISAAQAVEHYEISRYGTLIAWAKQLGQSDAAKLLDEIMQQEYSADEKLTKIAEDGLNRQAA